MPSTRLRLLDLTSIKAVDDTVLAELARWQPGLITLKCRSMNVSAAGVRKLGSLPSLELLEVGQCRDVAKLLEGPLRYPAFPALMAIELGSLGGTPWAGAR